MLTLSELISRHANPGKIEWIGTRPQRRGNMVAVEKAAINLSGLSGDHYSGTGKRAVTLIQHEHLSVIASLLQRDDIDAAMLRRNIVVSGINLLSLRSSEFKIGTSVLKGTGICAPCSRMEETFGYGGYSAVRGHGGITAQVIQEGELTLGDQLLPVNAA